MTNEKSSAEAKRKRIKRFRDVMKDINELSDILEYDVQCDEMFPTTYDYAQMRRLKILCEKAEKAFQKLKP